MFKSSLRRASQPSAGAMPVGQAAAVAVSFSFSLSRSVTPGTLSAHTLVPKLCLCTRS
jgi:hypothetical protein